MRPSASKAKKQQAACKTNVFLRDNYPPGTLLTIDYGPDYNTDDYVQFECVPETRAHAAVAAATDKGRRTSRQKDKALYCICRGRDDGRAMVHCPGKRKGNGCAFGVWYHFECLKLSKRPTGVWHCPQCRGGRVV